jgi:RNA polymerase sigma factor for flagellar operon FliA
MENIHQAWETYAATKDPALKKELIVEYAGLVKYVAGRLTMYMGTNIEFDDLVSFGIFGLIDAIDKYDVKKGTKFETYASQRIRGAIIDQIRKMSWAPRTIREKNKKLQQAFYELESELGRTPSDEELAEKLGLTIVEVNELLSKSAALSLISLDGYLEQNHE